MKTPASRSFRTHGRLVLISTVFSLLVTCQTVFLAQLAGPDPLSRPQAIEKDCRTAEQPPWVDAEPSREPCPFEATTPKTEAPPRSTGAAGGSHRS